MATVTHELKVCTDCLFFIANGDLPENENDAARVVAGVESFAPGYVAPTGEGEGSFSWRPCECCGCKLGGDRHDAVVLGDEESAEPESIECPACCADRTDHHVLGVLGALHWFRCRECGIDFNLSRTEA